ncbi:hypothetical protein CAter10_4232 [Collimonas arenae]|nr:hypothetical protein CAter10_4232 [Collimonas arenae]
MCATIIALSCRPGMLFTNPDNDMRIKHELRQCNLAAWR